MLLPVSEVELNIVFGEKNRQVSSDPTNELFFSFNLETKNIFSKIKPFLYQITGVGEKSLFYGWEKKV